MSRQDYNPINYHDWNVTRQWTKEGTSWSLGGCRKRSLAIINIVSLCYHNPPSIVLSRSVILFIEVDIFFMHFNSFIKIAEDGKNSLKFQRKSSRREKRKKPAITTKSVQRKINFNQHQCAPFGIVWQLCCLLARQWRRWNSLHLSFWPQSDHPSFHVVVLMQAKTKSKQRE